jgi:hypothetical protein
MRYLEEFTDKRSIADDKDHLRKLDPYFRGNRLDQINMEVLWPFIRDRRERDKVANATINRAFVRDGATVCALGAGASCERGQENRTGLGRRGGKPYDFPTSDLIVRTRECKYLKDWRARTDSNRRPLVRRLILPI